MFRPLQGVSKGFNGKESFVLPALAQFHRAAKISKLAEHNKITLTRIRLPAKTPCDTYNLRLVSSFLAWELYKIWPCTDQMRNWDLSKAWFKLHTIANAK